jgi:hypothetical protein
MGVMVRIWGLRVGRWLVVELAMEVCRGGGKK